VELIHQNSRYFGESGPLGQMLMPSEVRRASLNISSCHARTPRGYSLYVGQMTAWFAEYFL
jgi:hypothetical protein